MRSVRGVRSAPPISAEKTLSGFYKRAIEFNDNLITTSLDFYDKQQKEVSLYLFKASSKKLRLLFANALIAAVLEQKGFSIDCIEKKLKDMAAWVCSLEMIHTSSLYHDDILDNATTRRGVSAAHVCFAFNDVVVAPYHIISSCQKINQVFGKNYILELIHGMVQDLEQGEEMQEKMRSSTELDQLTAFDFYITKNYKKAATLFAHGVEGICCLLELDPLMATQLLKIGLFAGVFFQIRDDILDYVVDKANKQASKDFDEGILTLPFFEYLSQKPPDVAKALIKEYLEAQGGMTSIRFDYISNASNIALCEHFVDRCYNEFEKTLVSIWPDVSRPHTNFFIHICYQMFYRAS